MRRVRKTVFHAQFHAVLVQGREARTSDDLGVNLMEALYTLYKFNKGKAVKRGLKKGLEEGVKQWLDF